MRWTEPKTRASNLDAQLLTEVLRERPGLADGNCGFSGVSRFRIRCVGGAAALAAGVPRVWPSTGLGLTL